MTHIAIIDYGTSNLLSVVRAFRHIGADVDVVDRAERVTARSHLVVPGVGAFGACIDAMTNSGFTDPVIEHIRAGRPFLGICVGMQMMFDASEEFGVHQGLGMIAGRVKAISPVGANGLTHRIPHIGWSTLDRAGSVDGWSGSLLDSVTAGDSFYFVHSFMGVPDDPRHLLATADYDGIPITAAVRVENAFGFQFHPEKSGPAGLRLLESFARA